MHADLFVVTVRLAGHVGGTLASRSSTARANTGIHIANTGTDKARAALVGRDACALPTVSSFVGFNALTVLALVEFVAFVSGTFARSALPCGETLLRGVTAALFGAEQEIALAVAANVKSIGFTGARAAWSTGGGLGQTQLEAVCNLAVLLARFNAATVAVCLTALPTFFIGAVKRTGQGTLAFLTTCAGGSQHFPITWGQAQSIRLGNTSHADTYVGAVALR